MTLAAAQLTLDCSHGNFFGTRGVICASQ
jgi:hypothetical protein